MLLYDLFNRAFKIFNANLQEINYQQIYYPFRKILDSNSIYNSYLYPFCFKIYIYIYIYIKKNTLALLQLIAFIRSSALYNFNYFSNADIYG